MPGEQEQSAQQRQGAETLGEPSTFKNVIRILQVCYCPKEPDHKHDALF